MCSLTFQSLAENPLINFLGFFLVHSLWQATLIAAAAAILLLSLRRAPANLRYLVAAVALVAMIGLPVLTSGFCAQIPIPTSAVVPVGGSSSAIIAPAPTQFAQTTRTVPPPDSASSIHNDIRRLADSRRTWSDECGRAQSWFSTSMATISQTLRQWFPLIVAGWAVGIAFLVARLLAGLRLVRILRASGRPASDARCQTALNRLVETMGIRSLVRLVESRLATVPAVIGWFCPMILVPGVNPKAVILPDTPKTIDFVLIHAARLRGTLIDQEGKKRSGFQISLIGPELPPSSSVVAQTRTDESGRFEIKDIPTGFKFQKVVEPIKAESPWLAWASPPIKFVADDSNDAHLRFSESDKVIDFSAQSLTVLLHGPGHAWEKLRVKSKSESLALKYDGLSNTDGTMVSAEMAWIELGK